jgi:hypothetical protein
MATTTKAGPARASGSAEAGREFAGLIMHLLARRANGITTTNVDRRLEKALQHDAESRRLLQRTVERGLKLPAERRASLFSPAFARLSPATEISSDRIGDVVRRAQVRVAPRATTATQHAYELRFQHLLCIDESNPEFPGSDEPYVVFGALSQAQADAGRPAHKVRTPIYEKVNDGVRRPASGSQNLRLFGPSGPAKIGDGVLLTAACFEHDLGDAAEIVELVGDVLTAVGVVATEIELDVVALIAGALGAIAGLIAAWGEDDPVGDPVAVALTQAQADAKTNSDADHSVLLTPMVFNGGSANGTYKAFVVLRRA